MRDYQAVWNAALEAVASERPELIVWTGQRCTQEADFLRRPYPPLADAYVERNRHIVDAVTATMVSSEFSGTPVALPPETATPAAFTPITPRRVLDTRKAGVSTGEEGVLSVDLSSVITADATAVAVNLTTTGTSQGGFFTAFDCATNQPNVSHLNHAAQQDRGGFAIIPMPRSSELCVYSYADSHVIVDLQGSFSPTATLQFAPSTLSEFSIPAEPAGRRRRILRVHVAQGVAAASMTLTVIGGDAPGFLTTYPCTATIPDVSNVNYLQGEPVAGSAYVPLADGELCIYTSSSVDVIVDLTGTFSETAPLRFASSPSSITR